MKRIIIKTDRPPQPDAFLVVIDQPFVEELLSEELFWKGVRITGAEKAAEAMETLGADRFDIVLLDIYLQISAGNQMLQRLKREDPQISVLIVSACNGFTDEVKPAGADAEYADEERFPEKLAKKIEDVLIRNYRHQEEVKFIRGNALERLKKKIEKSGTRSAEQYSLKIATLQTPAAPPCQEKTKGLCRQAAGGTLKDKKLWFCEHIRTYEAIHEIGWLRFEFSGEIGIERQPNTWMLMA